MSEQEKETQETQPEAEHHHDELIVDEIAQLKLENEELREQVKALNDKMLRIVAEAENFKKGVLKDAEDSKNLILNEAENAKKYAVSSFAKELIEIVENFQLAMDNIDKTRLETDAEIKNIYIGIEMIFNSLLALFEKNKISRIDPLGAPFDHNYHQAVAQVVDNEKAPSTIVQVIRAGYVMDGRLLRPALVAVSKTE